MTHLSHADIQSFSNGFAGQLLTPGQPEYETARAVWNGAIDRKPAVIATCRTAHQVADAIRFARAHGLELSVRGGGHNYAGHAVCEGGLMIHLGAMNAVVVDQGSRRAICGGGATWADVDAATQHYGLATPGGFISHTGIAGLTLGGGIGWLTPLAGLSCDNLVSAEVVSAELAHPARIGDRTPRPVLGAARRRWQLRRRHVIRVRTASGRADDPPRLVLRRPR
jgi:FAD/FMN-containing dehydrogenase